LNALRHKLIAFYILEPKNQKKQMLLLNAFKSLIDQKDKRKAKNVSKSCPNFCEINSTFLSIQRVRKFNQILTTSISGCRSAKVTNDQLQVIA
jgi:hypothetical protein